MCTLPFTYREIFRDKEINIAVTPDGYADAVKSVCQEDGTDKQYFVMPEERTMNFPAFLDVIENPDR